MQISTQNPNHHTSHGTWAVPPPTLGVPHWQQPALDALALPLPPIEPSLPLIQLERIDLDFRAQKKHYGDRADAFFQANKDKLSLTRTQDLLSEWRKRTWPDERPGELLVTKLPPENGRHSWLIRPARFSDHTATQGMSQGSGGLVPAFKVFYKQGSLVVLGFEPRPDGPPGPWEHVVQGEIWINADRPCMSGPDVTALREMRHFAPSTSSRTARWRTYLDWREKLIEANSRHRYPYREWEAIKGQTKVRFYLRDPEAVDLLKLRLQGQQLAVHSPSSQVEIGRSATSDSRSNRTPKGATVGAYHQIVPLEGGQHRQSGAGNARYRKVKEGDGTPRPHTELVAVEVTLTEDQREQLKSGNVDLFLENGELAVDVTAELATIRNQRLAIDRLEQGHAVNPCIFKWLFNSQGARTPAFQPEMVMTDGRLNFDQRDAVAKALAAPDAFYLQGPPGTGKTTVIGELARQMIQHRGRTLVASQANLAVDNALAGLIPRGQASPEVRPLRLLDERREGEMEAPFKCFLKKMVVSHWLNRVADACAADLASPPPEGQAKWQVFKRSWIEQLRQNSRADNSEEMRQLYVRHANVVGATCSRTGKPDFYKSAEFDPTFDLVVIDEVSKATPPELLMPVLLGSKTVLVGDHRQLPPMFRSDTFEEAVANQELPAEELAQFKELVTASFFEELFIAAPPALRSILKEQYRMHPQIMDVVNHFYPDAQQQGILRAGGGREHLHKQRQHQIRLKGKEREPLLGHGNHVLWLDSTHDERGQPVREGTKRGTSRWNPYEVDLIAAFLEQLDTEHKEHAGEDTPKLDVGVISFYLAQTNELRAQLATGKAWNRLDVHVNTVDQFQGRECSVVIVSLVRCGEVSGDFVKDFRRINVAFSRAKSLLVIVGSKTAFCQADVPISPVEGGDPRSAKIYHEIGNLVARHRGLRSPSHVWGSSNL